MSSYYLQFSYRAFIPQSIGRPLGEIFRNHPHFNRQDLVNYDKFSSFLQRMDLTGKILGRGGNWLPEPEPIGGLLRTFAMTNDGEFDAASEYRQHTTGKVSINGVIDLREVGRIPEMRPPITILSLIDAYQCQAAIIPQKSGVPSNINSDNLYSYPSTGRYIGIYREAKKEKAVVSSNATAKNKNEGPYFRPFGTTSQMPYDTTIITAKASASYPFVPIVAPNIDMQLTIKLRRMGNKIDISFEGLHDQFPAYELIVNNVRKCRWDPKANGQFGPNPINLNANYLRTQVRTHYFMSQQLPYGYQQSRKFSPF